MAIFYSKIPGLSTSMRIKGAVYRIKFVPRDKPYNDVGLLAVGDPVLANAIRKHPYFGTVITELEEPKQEQAQETTKLYVASYPEVTGSQQAIAILVEKHGADASVLKGKAAVKEAAEKLNVEFSNFK